jgi:hypothetical protein
VELWSKFPEKNPGKWPKKKQKRAWPWLLQTSTKISNLPCIFLDCRFLTRTITTTGTRQGYSVASFTMHECWNGANVVKCAAWHCAACSFGFSDCH